MRIKNWVARKVEDFVIGPEERLNQDAERATNANAPKNPTNGKKK